VGFVFSGLDPQGLTCGEIATCVGHRLLAIVDGVGLHLVGGSRGQLLDAVLECVVVHLEGAVVAARGLRQAQHLDLKSRIAALGGR